MTEIKEGYKDTEIGVIPVEWDVDILENHINIISGQSPSKFDLTGTKYKFFKINQLNFCEKYLTDSEYAFDEEIDNLLDSGTVVFPKRGASIFTNKVRILTHKSFIDTNLMGLITKDTLNNMFLYYWLVEFELSNIADTSSVPQINNKHINPLKIPLPPLKEQEKIADILSTADDKIDAIASQIQKAQTLKKGLLQKLLSEGIGHSEFKDSELGMIPKSWEINKLDDMTIVITKGTTPTTLGFKYQDSGINFIKVESIDNNGNFDIEKFAYISEEANTSLQRSIIKENDLLISIAGALGRVAIVNKELIPANTNQALSIIRLKEGFIKEYIYFYLNSNQIQKHIDKINVQNAQANLSLQNIKNFKIPLPPLEEQKQIAEILSTTDEKLEVLMSKKQMYETLKKGLLQKLLSGEVRVGCVS